jgi:DNA-binding transcriptional ArsR family regulator
MSRKKPSSSPSQDDLARILAHPLRMRILRILNERVASPVEIARQLEQPLNTVAYHVRALLKANCIELVRRKQRRGAMEHFYRATTVPMFTDGQWAELPPSVTRQMFGAALADIFAHVSSAAQEGGFDHSETHVSWTALRLDEEGFDEVVGLLAEVLDKLPDIEARAAARRMAAARDGDEPDVEHRTEAVLLHFHRGGTPRGSG